MPQINTVLTRATKALLEAVRTETNAAIANGSQEELRAIALQLEHYRAIISNTIIAAEGKANAAKFARPEAIQGMRHLRV